MKKNKNIGLCVALVAVVGVIILGFFLPRADSPLLPESSTIRATQSEVKTKATTESMENASAKSAEKPNDEAIKQPVTEISKETVPKVSIGERNALAKAKEYLRVMAFSYNSLVRQLEFEGFTQDECAYGVDNCGANWNEQAVRKANEYLKSGSFSRQGLINQLLFEGFSQEQAEYGVSKVGY